MPNAEGEEAELVVISRHWYSEGTRGNLAST